ncbi:VanZ family protein [Streptomyces sp. NPDC087908]|uniref:VanZ family protein n=1 Tax=Streptomyces sp. NPDC087908 TaxID=3365820 RepID=UPI00381A874D
MIHAVFRDHLLFLALAITVTLAAGVLAYGVAARNVDRRPAVFYGLWASSTVGPVLLTTWGGSGIATLQCTINPAYVQAFATTQGQLNVALFVPFGLLAVLATRRILLSAALGALFTAAVETAQATLPLVSRLCDTDDLVTNAVGALIGVGIGAAVCRAARHGSPLSSPAVKRSVFGGAVISLVIAATWVTVIEPVRAVFPMPVPPASPEQVRALRAELERAFGETYSIETASFFNNVDGSSTVSALLPGGTAEMTWPDREKFTVHFSPTNPGEGEGTYAYRIPGTSRPVRTSGQAQQVATRFAESYAPWALRDSEAGVRQARSTVEDSGWIVEWRRQRNDTLMPMRFGLLIEPSGRIGALLARDVDDPKLPPVAVTENTAWNAFATHHQVRPAKGERRTAVLLAERQKSAWRVYWRLTAAYDDTLLSATVDAASGIVAESSASQASEGTLPSMDEMEGF